VKRKLLLLIPLVLLAAFLVTLVVQAGASSNYRIDWMVPITGGSSSPSSGPSSSSSSYTVELTVGQTVIGEATSTTMINTMGFWHEDLYRFKVYMPYLSKP